MLCRPEGKHWAHKTIKYISCTQFTNGGGLSRSFLFSRKKYALKLQYCQIPPLLYFSFNQAPYLVLKAINVWWPWSIFQIPFEWQVAPMPTALHNIVPPWVKWLGIRGLPLACMPVHLHFNSIEKNCPKKKHFCIPYCRAGGRSQVSEGSETPACLHAGPPAFDGDHDDGDDYCYVRSF